MISGETLSTIAFSICTIPGFDADSYETDSN